MDKTKMKTPKFKIGQRVWYRKDSIGYMRNVKGTIIFCHDEKLKWCGDFNFYYTMKIDELEEYVDVIEPVISELLDEENFDEDEYFYDAYAGKEDYDEKGKKFRSYDLVWIVAGSLKKYIGMIIEYDKRSSKYLVLREGDIKTYCDETWMKKRLPLKKSSKVVVKFDDFSLSGNVMRSVRKFPYDLYYTYWVKLDNKKLGCGIFPENFVFKNDGETL